MRIAVLDDYQDVARSYGDWGSLAADVDFVHEHLDDEALVERVSGCEVIVAMRERTRFPRALLERLPSLRLLVTTGMRNASIDLAAASDLDVVVCGTSGWGSSTAELTWALIMSLVRPIDAYDAAIRDGGWQRSVGGDLAGRTIGLVGLGRQGAAIARYAMAFEMDVVAWSPNLTSERAAEHGARAVSRAELFAGSDIVSLHLVLSDRTRDLIGADDLRSMRSDSYLVNTSRAGLVEPDALRRAVEESWIAGVALDVFDVEPLPAEHWLRSAPRTVLSPHMGYVSDAGYRAFYGGAVEDVAAFLAGSPVRILS